MKGLVIIRPGGNDTALVFAPISPGDYKIANECIMKDHPNVEQVMFVHRPVGAVPQGLMAGGEFCANAIRALGFYLLKGKDGTIDLKVSGAKSPVTVTVKNGQSTLCIDLGHVHKLSLPGGLTRVDLNEMTHVVADAQSNFAQAFMRMPTVLQKEIFLQKLAEWQCENSSATGFMIYDSGQGTLMPYVYVKDIDTFMLETACGSGSIATALALNLDRLSLKQPSGDVLQVTCQCAGNDCAADLSGPASILQEIPDWVWTSSENER